MVNCTYADIVILSTDVTQPGEKEAWMTAKDRGEKLFNQRHGDFSKIFKERSLAPGMDSYCFNDFRVTPRLGGCLKSRGVLRDGERNLFIELAA